MNNSDFVLQRLFSFVQEVYIHTHEIDPFFIFERDMIEYIPSNTFQNIINQSYIEAVDIDLLDGSISEYDNLIRSKYIFNKLDVIEQQIVIDGFFENLNLII